MIVPDTDTSTLTTTVDGTTSTNVSTNTESTTITLSSETLSSRTVPVGMFSVYVITFERTVTQADGTQGTNTTGKIDFSPQVGIVEEDERTETESPGR